MIRAELLKLTSTRAPKIAAAVGILGVAATQLAAGWLLPAISHLDPDLDASVAEMSTSTAESQLLAMNVLGGGSMSSGSVSIGLVAILLLGALLATSDFKHGGIVTTALAAPRRGRIVGAKVAATALAVLLTGLGYALVQGFLVAVAPSTIGAGGIAASWWEVADVLGRGVLTLIPLGILGLAAGILIRSQSATFLVLIGAAVADVTLGAILSVIPATAELSSYTPLALVSTASGPGGGLGAGLALGILTMMALAAAGAAWVTLRRRDL
ncbi:hypothetical protein [Nesterenkonia lutea]|uniref:ABC transporter permease n=1 Tax=Nesterenkonia lutea TaxID=272919 RepID=A0ABR9JDB9_9MICC|nr:hypothetical protein [Nesterenkonia lutea]MBE1523927.1 hypothetical protein [Nesterenkonia lutea]